VVRRDVHPSRMSSQRLNITRDGEHAAKLARLAERVHVNEGTLARSLLSSAIDGHDPDPANVAALLDGIDGAWERRPRYRAIRVSACATLSHRCSSSRGSALNSPDAGRASGSSSALGAGCCSSTSSTRIVTGSWSSRFRNARTSTAATGQCYRAFCTGALQRGVASITVTRRRSRLTSWWTR